MPARLFLERPSFQKVIFYIKVRPYFLKKILYFRVFFKKDHLSFSVQRVRSYFREKEISSFPIIQERSYSSTIFLERPSFQDVWKKKIWFSVQCVKKMLINLLKTKIKTQCIDCNGMCK